jgi:hypothetical protein
MQGFPGTLPAMARPTHATIVAYLALFVALCTGAAFAATKITSSKQIKRGVVNSGDVKNASLVGKDIADGGLTAADLADGSVNGGKIADDSVNGGKIADGSIDGADLLDGGITGAELENLSVPGGKLAPDSVTGFEIDESTLDISRGFTNFAPGSVNLDNGLNGSAFPQEPEGSIAAIALPPGRYLITVHALVSADDNGGGAYCLFGGAGDYIETGAFSSSIDLDTLPSTPTSISASMIRESDDSFLTRLICSDANTGMTANDRNMVAVKLRD